MTDIEPQCDGWAFAFLASRGVVLTPNELDHVAELAEQAVAVEARLRDLVTPDLPFTAIYSAEERTA
jgi:hypothetical protein